MKHRNKKKTTDERYEYRSGIYIVFIYIVGSVVGGLFVGWLFTLIVITFLFINSAAKGNPLKRSFRQIGAVL